METIDYPQVEPGDQVVIELRYRGYQRADGTKGWVYLRPEVMTVLAPDRCDSEDGPHVTTICSDCIGTWSMDHYVALADQGGQP